MSIRYLKLRKWDGKMGSKVGEAKRHGSIDFVDGYKAMEIKNRRKPHHWKLSKKLTRYDNDELFMIGDSIDGLGFAELGINKKIAKINDDDGFDGEKDGN